MTDLDALLRLRAVLEKMVSRQDIAVRVANVAEVLLVELYEGEPDLDDLALSLAMYQPGGGDFLYSIDDLDSALKGALSRVVSDLEALRD
jgi:hypothetical protein